MQRPLLSDVVLHEVAADAFIRDVHEVAGLVAGRRLNLDDLRTEIAEESGAERARRVPG